MLIHPEFKTRGIFMCLERGCQILNYGIQSFGVEWCFGLGVFRSELSWTRLKFKSCIRSGTPKGLLIVINKHPNNNWPVMNSSIADKEVPCLFVWFGLNVAFNNLSVISRRCLDVTGSSMLTFRVLPHWNIMPQTLWHDIPPSHIILTLSWPVLIPSSTFLMLSAKRKSS